MSVVVKTSRIDIRLTDDDKAIIERAAACNRQSTTSYIVSVVIKQAQLDLIRNELIHLSREDMERLIQMLDNPPEPNDNLKKLFK